MVGLEYYYWLYKSVLPIETCKNIIHFCKNIKLQKGLTEAETIDPKANSNRQSDVRWIEEPWIYNEIIPFVHDANKRAGWDFNVDWNESLQFTEYKENQYYGWHADNFNKPFGEDRHINYRGKIRKISMTVSLSNPNDYEGGDFQIDIRNNAAGNRIDTIYDVKEQGSILIFPSFVFHQVTPVIKGERNSLVMWCIGPKWN